MDSQFLISSLSKPRKIAVFIPTNLPSKEDPRDLSPRALARLQVGIGLARRLRQEVGRANVVVVLFGGWPLHKRLPLAVHHAYAAINIHKLLSADELDFITSYGINTTTDLHGTLRWMKESLLDVQEAYVVTSRGHAERLVAESDMHSLFKIINHVETQEPRYTETEDVEWTERAKDIPPHQYVVSGRASDVTRFGSIDSLEWAEKMRLWAHEHPTEFTQYIANIWELIGNLEENNVVIRSRTPGCWRIDINL
jgi:hypothetical protein